MPDDLGRQACTVALQCAINDFSFSLGITATQTVDLQRKKINLLRRDGYLEEAADAARLLYDAAIREYGVASDQGIAAARALAYVLMRKEDYLEARGICLSIVTPQLFGSADVDNAVAHTMEDIAEIDWQLGNMSGATFWLEQADEMASYCWGESIATIHIRDKLREAKIGCPFVAD